MEPGDKELLERLKNDDAEALKVLFYRHFNTLATIGQRMSGDIDEGKDIAQKVFIRFWEKRGDIVINESAISYLKRMAINESVAESRTRKRRQEIRGGMETASQTSETGETQVIQAETKETIMVAVENLPDKCREVFKMSRFEELTYKEISETLNISVKTVESHMGRALRELRGALRQFISILF